LPSLPKAQTTLNLIKLMLDYHNPQLILTSSEATNVEGNVFWRSPSNIAIVKYWGKHGQQLPQNPSISFTLQNAVSETSISFQAKTDKNTPHSISLDFFFNEKPRPDFANKIIKFFGNLQTESILPFLSQLHFTIHSKNTFPHSAGIASSASSMSALALCLCSIEQQIFGGLTDESAFFQKASFLARLGSGSACRSVYPVMGWWGEMDGMETSSDLYAVPCAEWVHPVFHTFHDDILIVSRGEKSVSSRAGHQLMEGNIYAAPRYQQARDNMIALKNILETGDITAFGQIAESEALTLHALMMTSQPPYILIQPGTLSIIEHIRTFREDTGLPVYFSLDAGPNIHLLYPDDIKDVIKEFINLELRAFCQDGLIIEDQVGKGPSRD
jgi:diphosphomevalonate decarboxylase